MTETRNTKSVRPRYRDKVGEPPRLEDIKFPGMKSSLSIFYRRMARWMASQGLAKKRWRWAQAIGKVLAHHTAAAVLPQPQLDRRLRFKAHQSLQAALQSTEKLAPIPLPHLLTIKDLAGILRVGYAQAKIITDRELVPIGGVVKMGGVIRIHPWALVKLLRLPDYNKCPVCARPWKVQLA